MASQAWFVLLSVLLPSACLAQVHDVLCNAGNTSFEASFRTGVTVSIGPQKDGEFSTRACHATLSWGKQKLVVASGISQLDLDMFGVDLSPGVPVAAFTTSKSSDACCMTYQIYSLKEPPQLLRTITGGGFFEAADTDLDGAVEIWTDDSAAVNGFEGLTPGEIDSVPTYVLRLEHNRCWTPAPSSTVFSTMSSKGSEQESIPTFCEVSKPAMEDCKRALIHLHWNSSA
jgi:hypothetical protein